MSLDWSRESKPQPRPCGYPGCSKPIEARVLIIIRKADRQATNLISRSRSFCKEHTEIMYAELEKVFIP